VWVFLCAHREARGQVPPKPLLFETLYGESTIRFLGCVYATAQNIFFFLATWQEKLNKDLDPQSAWKGMISLSSYCFGILQIIYVSYIHLCCFICSHEFISSVLSYYNMSYMCVLILQSCCLCCYLFIFSCSIIIHVPCLYAYYIYMIHMLYVLMIYIGMDIFEITISMINYLLYVIIIMLI
jgi:hypothetical protein